MRKRAHLTLTSVVLGLSAGLWAGCSDSVTPSSQPESEPSPSGAITVHTATWGWWADVDGYGLSIDGDSGRPVSLSDSVTVEGLEPGQHEVALTDVADECVVDGSNPRIVTVRSGTTSTTFHVDCTGPDLTLAVVSGDDQAGRPGEAFPEPLVVQVTDSVGVGRAGVPVDWRITAGDGTLASSFGPPGSSLVLEASTVTDGDGLAEVPLIPLGFETLEIIADAYPAHGSPVAFHADATDPGALLAAVSGNNQPAHAGLQIDEPFVVRVADGQDVPAEDVRVVWAIESGDGDFGRDQLGNRLLRDTIRTDADGLARVSLTPTWFGPVEVSASAVGTGGSPLAFAVDATDSGAALSIVSGDRQDGMAGDLLAEPLVVSVTDGLGNPAANVRVTWRVAPGDGYFGDGSDGPSYETTSRYTDGQGLAHVSFSPTSLGAVGADAQLDGSSSMKSFTTNVVGLVIHYGVYPWVGVGLDDVTCVRWTEAVCTESAVPVGTKVAWVNDVARVQIMSTSKPPNGPSFDSGVLLQDERFEFVPSVVGTWEYEVENQGWSVTSTLAAY